MILDEIRKYLARYYWTSEQVAGYIANSVYHRRVFRQTSEGAQHAALPVILGSSGKLDPSLYNDLLGGDSYIDAAFYNAPGARVGGVLYSQTSVGANSGSSETDLAQLSVPASTLASNGQSLWFEAWGVTAANANNKTVRVRFGTSGTNLIFQAGPTGWNGLTWNVRGRIWRTAATTQKAYTQWMISTSAQAGGNGGLDQTLSGAVSLRVTGQGSSSSDISLINFIVGWDNA